MTSSSSPGSTRNDREMYRLPRGCTPEQLEPFLSAADVDVANYPRIRFDHDIGWTVNYMGSRRAPTDSSVWRHQVGFAGELATAAYLGVEPNWTVSDPFVGDDGYDMIYEGQRVEVKTVTQHEDRELKVPESDVSDADFFVLANCTDPTELVKLIGVASQPRLRIFGYKFQGGDLVRLDPRYLETLEPLFIPPDKVRATVEPSGGV